MNRRSALRRAVAAPVLLGVLLCAVAAIGTAAAPAGAAGSTALVGTFRITPGSCAGGSVSGSYLQMILPSGGASGPYLSNTDSTCSNAAYTLLRPGSDGGLVTGGYQPTPSPIFDAKGNAQADRITQPATFYGTGFATATASKDPQTGVAVPAPSVTAKGSTLTGDLRSFAVTWNNQYFNQGAPKPDGSLAGNTHAVTGTYNASTGAYTLNWSSQVVGGPFDKFAGSWHLTGTFVPAGRSSARPASSPMGHAGASAPAGGVAAPTAHPAGGVTPPAGVPSATLSVPPTSTSSTAAAGTGVGATGTGTGTGTVPSSAPISANEVVSASTTVSHGWRAPLWLILLVAVVALVALYVLFSVQRAIGAASRSGQAGDASTGSGAGEGTS